MERERFWFDALTLEVCKQAGSRPGVTAADSARLAIARSCVAGNFEAPHDDLGYWVEYDPANPHIPWFRFASQGFEPRLKDWGEMSEEQSEKLRASRQSANGPGRPRKNNSLHSAPLTQAVLL